MADLIIRNVDSISFISTSAAIGWFYDPYIGIISASSYAVVKITAFAISTIRQSIALKKAYEQHSRELSISRRVIRNCYFVIGYLTKKLFRQTQELEQLHHDCRKAQESDAENLKLLCILSEATREKQQQILALQSQLEARDRREEGGLRAALTNALINQRPSRIDARQLATLRIQKEQLEARIRSLEAQTGLCRQCSAPSLDQEAGAHSD